MESGQSGGEQEKIEPPPVLWPAGFPLGCPPPDAVQASGTVYRVVYSDPPIADDFKPWIEENWHVTDEHGNPKAWAISVSDILTDAQATAEGMRLREQARRVPGLRARMIAVGSLRAEFGMMKPTPSRKNLSHRSWWLCVGVDPSRAFKVVPVRR
jgi:hypothetical protein